MKTLGEFVNEGRLFPVKPGFADALEYEFMRDLRASVIDMNRVAFGERIPAAPGTPIKYFTPADQQRLDATALRCDRYVELGDDTLWCNLDAGHSGPHYDAISRVEWSQR